jgi:hypothetical protein
MNAQARRPDRRTIAWLLLLACLLGLLPRALAADLAIPRAAGWIGLSTLAVLVATHRLGWR